MELEFASNLDLLNELLDRRTFAGIVIACEGGEVKCSKGQEAQINFNVSWRNMTREQAVLHMHKAIELIASGQGEDFENII